MTDEPMVERLTDEELAERRNKPPHWRDGPHDRERYLATIDTLSSQLREQRERAERAEGLIKSAVWDLTHGVAPDLIAVALLRHVDPVAPTPTRRTANE